ncbi:hypothetical protein F5J12DRAFT_840699 [Pisolithus orientalis]|uniref:uncharacterized protein n=1 Tax=Pisolithus orientalis TaxID=936130 RepID=UPI002224BDA9|nr:uncharacterized protein F5J12DRAFT_840699 [Pisolithus orientalis]KAI6002378.1 hypothetical protein F5J12DRAFT_840699 [Pisolithus orientalis]
MSRLSRTLVMFNHPEIRIMHLEYLFPAHTPGATAVNSTGDSVVPVRPDMLKSEHFLDEEDKVMHVVIEPKTKDAGDCPEDGSLGDCSDEMLRSRLTTMGCRLAEMRHEHNMERHGSEMKKLDDEFRRSIDRTKKSINDLKRVHSEIRKEQSELGHAIATLNVQVDERYRKYTNETDDLCQAISFLVLFHHGILLDMAEEKMIRCFGKESWERLCASHLPLPKLARRIKNKLKERRQSHTPSVEELMYLFSHIYVRKKPDVRDVTHRATQEELKEAIMAVPVDEQPENRQFLESLFEFLFEQPFDS